MTIRMRHDDKIADNTDIHFQVALLYTTSYGARRIRIHTLTLRAGSQYADFFRGADMDAILTVIPKIGMGAAFIFFFLSVCLSVCLSIYLSVSLSPFCSLFSNLHTILLYHVLSEHGEFFSPGTPGPCHVIDGAVADGAVADAQGRAMRW